MKTIITTALVSAATTFALGVVYQNAPLAQPTESLPFCTYEDGNINGKPCIWVDPDTGDMWRVESTNYQVARERTR